MKKKSKEGHLRTLLSVASTEQLEVELRRRKEAPTGAAGMSLNDFTASQFDDLQSFRLWAEAKQNENAISQSLAYDEWFDLLCGDWRDEFYGSDPPET